MKQKTGAASPAEVKRLIVLYLVAHPNAADTAQGIQRWWLSPTHGELPLPWVEDALRQLQAEGLIQRHDRLSAEPMWGAAPGGAVRPKAH